MFPSSKNKTRILGGKEYRILGSTTESERGRVVFQSFTTPIGKVVLKNGKVWHPDGAVTDASGNPLAAEPAPTE